MYRVLLNMMLVPGRPGGLFIYSVAKAAARPGHLDAEVEGADARWAPCRSLWNRIMRWVVRGPSEKELRGSARVHALVFVWLDHVSLHDERAAAAAAVSSRSAVTKWVLIIFGATTQHLFIKH